VAFIEMSKDTELMKYFPKTLSKTETLEMLRKIKLNLEKNNFGLFAVEEKLINQFIGFTRFAKPAFESFFMPCVEIGRCFKKEVWGRALLQRLRILV
jgi:ribosomal-protein-alanine N-acetyltransferase